VSSPIERIVLDTNVLASAFLNPAGAPAKVLTLVLAGEFRLLIDQRILDDYAEVLARPRFEIDPGDSAEVLRQIGADGERVEAARSDAQLPEADDLQFVEVALSGRADALVTGNVRHFPGALGFEVLSPRALLQKIEAE
jgi:putative PIN family toxin of toxin-antitoxin system